MNEENENASPWDSLIGELGVEVNPEALERKQPTPQKVPPIAAERHEVAPPVPAPSDWGALASSLGLEVPAEEPPRPAESTARQAAQPQSADRPREEPSRADRGPQEKARDEQPRGGRRREERTRSDEQTAEQQGSEQQGEERPRRGRARDDRKDRGRPRRHEERVEVQADPEFEEVVEDLDDELVQGESATERDATESDPQDPDKPRISGEAARSAFDALFSAEAVNWGSAFVSPRTNVESSFLFSEGEEAVFAEEILDKTEIDEDDDNGEEPKKRRRRRRGGRGRGRGRSDETADSEGADDERADDVEGDADLAADDTADERTEVGEGAEPDKRPRRRRGRGGRRRSEEADSTSEEGDESHARRRVAAHVGEDGDDDDLDEDFTEAAEGSRSGHRNLPTWNDAIGVIVESNLAHRSKAPAKQQNQSRGRGRGGRRHKK